MLLNVLDHTRIQPGVTHTFLASCKVSDIQLSLMQEDRR